MIVFQRKAPLLGALTLTLAAWSMPAWSTGGCASTFQGRYGGGAGTTYDAAGCQTCHTSSIPALNGYGADVGRCSSSDFDTAETLDSDTADGQPSVGGNNLAEITAGAQPGWCVVGTPNCVNVQTPPASISGPLDPPQTNEPPVAVIGGPYSGEAGTALQFDGSASFDPDGSVQSYSWDFGDGNSGSGAAPIHTYASAGSFTVSLVVSDGSVDSAAATTTADIAEPAGNTPPIADVGGPYSGITGTPVQFDGSGSSDPNGDPLTYRWDFGDGSVGDGEMPSHGFAAAGTYTVTLQVNDGEFDSAPDATTVAIGDPATGGDGEALYRVNCLGCHGSPWEAPAFDMDALPGVRRVAGARECTIEGSIFGTSVYPGGVPSMQYLQDVLTDEEIAAIAEYLNSRAATGEQRYVAACAGCHGPTGSGGPVGESIHGEDAGDIAEAIEEDAEMRFLGCLPESDIVSIGGYLVSFGDDDGGGGGGTAGLWLLAAPALARLVRRRRYNLEEEH